MGREHRLDELRPRLLQRRGADAPQEPDESPGHKANILNAAFREIGIGIQTGDYQGWDGIFATQAFAKTGTDLFITGVAFRDKDSDHAYDPGEGLGGLTVKAVGGGSTVTTTTGPAGGYALALDAGKYTVTFSGGGFATVTRTVAVGSKNVKVDLVDPTAVPGVSKVGTAAANGLSGGAGNDTLKGLGGNDTLAGKAGNDRLYGGDGSDKLVGSTGRDLLQGDGGNDFLYGGADNDVFRFVGAFGNDRIFDFRQGDRMDLRGHHLAFAKLTISQRDLDKDGVVDDVLVRMPGHSLSLMNVKLATIDKGDFIF